MGLLIVDGFCRFLMVDNGLRQLDMGLLVHYRFGNRDRTLVVVDDRFSEGNWLHMSLLMGDYRLNKLNMLLLLLINNGFHYRRLWNGRLMEDNRFLFNNLMMMMMDNRLDNGL